MANIKELLLQLKDHTRCNDDLAITIRQTVLEPFQLDLTKLDAVKKPPPTPAKFKQMAAQLAPFAMRIVNQNIESLAELKRTVSKSAKYIITVNCLVDTSFYALTALRHMNTHTTLKPLDIEKTTSNLIGKMVDIGEYHRALDELRKFRSVLASVAKVQLDSKLTVDNKQSTIPKKRVLAETQDNNQSTYKRSFLPVPNSMIGNQWEQEMLYKYQDLFQFPYDTTINDRTMILLVLAYQMNALRCWCEASDGALAKYVPYFLEKSGNFIDWSKHLYKIDAEIAKKQLDSFQRLLYKAANKYPLTEAAAFHCYNLQTVALNTIKLSGTSPLKPVMDRMVRIGMTYEKATNQTSYDEVQERCKVFLEDLNPNVHNEMELDSYFILCEYYAYVSQKIKSHQGLFYAYKFMIRPLVQVILSPSSCSFYHAAYATNAKLLLTSLQMDKMIADDTFMDINGVFNEIIACLNVVSTTLEKSPPQNEHTERALYSLCKSIDGFRQSAKYLYEFVSNKTKKALQESCNNPFKTPPRQGELVTPSDFGPWNTNMTQLNTVLQLCSEILPATLILTKKKPNPANKRTVSQTDVMTSFIDIMVLLARMGFNILDEDAHYVAYGYLSTAERKCTEVNFPEGYRWLSGSYYNLGATMIKTELYKPALYPLRKACTLLRKDTERINSLEGRLQLCKRYEILGTCCQKNGNYEDAISAYRSALKSVPKSTFEKFVSRADTTAVSTIIETDPFVPKLIDRFLRSSIIDPNQSEIRFANELMDLSGLTPIQQAVVYECELKVWNFLALKMNVSKFQLAIVENLLLIYNVTNYPIRRARVLLNHVCIERTRFANKEQSTREAMTSAQNAIQHLNVTNYGKDTDLLNYRYHYLALASSWVVICGRELQEQVSHNFGTTLQQWGLLLNSITPIYNSGGSSKHDIEQVYKSIDDMEQLYDHVRMLADLFGVTGEYVYQIRALRILLKLNNQLRDVNVDHVSESIILSCKLGLVYTDLGYNGEAASEFKNAKNAILHKPCNNMSELVYGISYSNYLARIGQYESSKKIFDETKMVWDHTPTTDIKNPLLTAREYTERCMVLSDAYVTRSLILANTDTLQNAIDCSTAALQLINKCIKVTQKAIVDRSEKKKVSTELENPFAPTPPPASAEQDEMKVVFRESQWTMGQKLGKCLNTLASLYMRKGSWNEVTYFMKEGPLLAAKVNSNAIYFYSYLISSEFHRRCGNLDLAQEGIDQATAYKPTGEHHNLDQVCLQLTEANLEASRGYYNDAITNFEKIRTELDRLTGTDYISSIEQTEHLREPNTRVMFDDETKKSDKGDCAPLETIQTSITIQLSLALASKGETKEGLLLLEKLYESGFETQNETEFNAAIGHIKMLLLREELSSRPDANTLLYESVSLPEMKLTHKDRRITTGSTKNERLLMQDDFTNLMGRMILAYHSGYVRERPVLIEGVCKHSAFSTLLQSQMLNNSTNNDALNSSYYLEIAKGVCLRRDMQNCLKLKTRRSHPPNDKNWPSENNRAPNFFDFELGWLESHLSTLATLYGDEKNLEIADFQDKYINIVPVHWTVCSLTYDPMNQDLYAVRMRTGETPFVVKIPLNRCKYRSKSNSVIKYDEALQEFQAIIEGSDETIRNSSNCNDPTQVEDWWNTRRDLDDRMRNLLNSIENQWLSGFKGILGGRTFESMNDLLVLQKNLSEFAYKMMSSISSKLKQVELDINFCRMMVRLGPRPNPRDSEDLAYFVLSRYDAQDGELDHSKLDMKKMVDYIKLLNTRYYDASHRAGIDPTKILPNDHVILILDKHLQMFPIESIPILFKQSVSRLPCLSFLRDRILYARAHATRTSPNTAKKTTKWEDLSVSKKSAFYVLNPSGDLKDTQKLFEPIFNNIPEWNGVTGTMPMELECKEALQSRDIYMYFGHSAGQSFMRGSSVRQLPKCAVSLLMGCSSGVLESKGEFDPYGYVLNYILGGSPAVVANLWDVTDRSIDRLTQYMLHSWGLTKSSNSEKNSLVQALTKSRSQGKLVYLIGAATVVYGIPVYVD